ncbi:MAG: carbon monoxide dehydrogenase subunit G [Betaproteobacteria bacterium]|nr:carbon monoxide dehydrogenase subunit G [Betaproteobacteria bacterium]
MELKNSRLLPVDRENAWKALNDPERLRASIAGCESIVPTGENEYEAAMTAAIGPVKAKFKGRLKLSDVVAPESYTLAFDGQGGPAGFGKGTARVTLTPEGAGTRLDYAVQAQVGGKIAQVGQRLIDGAARKMADDFFERFGAALATEAPAEVAAISSATVTGEPPGRAFPGWAWALAAAAASLVAFLALR